MSKDFFYNEVTKDLTLTEGKDLKFTEDIVDYTIQKIEKVLNFFYGEWYLNVFLGIPYIALENNDRDDNTKNIFVKNPDLSFINGIFVRSLTNISTIEKVVSFTSILNTSNRNFNITFEVKLINGELLQDSLGIGVL